MKVLHRFRGNQFLSPLLHTQFLLSRTLLFLSCEGQTDHTKLRDDWGSLLPPSLMALHTTAVSASWSMRKMPPQLKTLVLMKGRSCNIQVIYTSWIDNCTPSHKLLQSNIFEAYPSSLTRVTISGTFRMKDSDLEMLISACPALRHLDLTHSTAPSFWQYRISNSKLNFLYKIYLSERFYW